MPASDLELLYTVDRCGQDQTAYIYRDPQELIAKYTVLFYDNTGHIADKDVHLDDLSEAFDAAKNELVCNPWTHHGS